MSDDDREEPVSTPPEAPPADEASGEPSEPVQFPAVLVRRIALVSAATAGLCAVGLGVSYGPASALSVLLGALIGVVNLWALARLVVALLADGRGSSGAKARAAVLLGLKSIGLVTLVGVLVVNGYVHGGALMVGISMVALSIVVATVWPQGAEKK